MRPLARIHPMITRSITREIQESDENAERAQRTEEAKRAKRVEEDEEDLSVQVADLAERAEVAGEASCWDAITRAAVNTVDLDHGTTTTVIHNSSIPLNRTPLKNRVITFTINSPNGGQKPPFSSR